MSSIWDWSKTAGNNDTSDSDINFQENMVPSAVNNSCRQVMGRAAEILDDIGAVTSTTNLSDAYTLTANSAFTVLQDGLIVGFKASATNTGAATLNVNAIGSKAIRRIGASADVAIEAGTIVSGQKYLAIYDSAANAAAGAWILLNPLLVAMITSPTTGALGVASGNATLEVRSAGAAGDAAYMAFHRPSTFAAHFGIDTDNKLKVGGWSFGAVDHEIYHEGNREIPAGTRMVFYQASAPTGWTKVTGIDNRAMRVVDGAGGGSGGSVGFTTVFARTATDAHTLTTAEMPQHAHTASTSNQSSTFPLAFSPSYWGVMDTTSVTGVDLTTGAISVQKAVNTNTPNVTIPADNLNLSTTVNQSGSSNPHTHNMDMRVTYIDVIVCSRN